MEEKITQIAQLIKGLKYYEWSKIKIAIEQNYASAANKLELNDTEALLQTLKFEFSQEITP